MTKLLNNEFINGYNARQAMGKTMAISEKPSCPFYATSDSADAWHAGYAHACNTYAGFEYGGLTSLRVWHGRGYSINVKTRSNKSNQLGQFKYRAEYNSLDGFATLMQ